MTQARWNGIVIAESDNTLVLEGNHYFPASDIKQEYFRESQHTTVCGHKGQASYYHVVVDGQTNADSAWYYPTPKASVSEITGRVAFWKGVEVIP